MQIINYEENYMSSEHCAVALGFFDGVHRGHEQVIRKAKSFGIKTVVLTFKRHPSEFLSGMHVKLITANDLREQAVASAGADELVYLDFRQVRDYSAEEFIKKILIDGLNAEKVVCGYNYHFGKNAASGTKELEKLCRSFNIQAVALPPVCADGRPVSSTRIRNLITAGNIQEANRLLGRPFALRLEVIHGRMLGRRLGFPTLNQKLPEQQAVPLYGVYATQTMVNGLLMPSVTNVGVKPTVGSSDVLAETYVPELNCNLYGKVIEVRFRDFIRRETKFSGLEELKNAMLADSHTSLDKFKENYGGHEQAECL